jgi:CheY-like chemotaxis protein
VLQRRLRPARILLVEDSVTDAGLVAAALGDTAGTSALDRVDDGAQAAGHLDAVAAGTAPRPDLVILDLDLPRVGGIDLLTRIRADPRLREVPVVVFSTSRSDVDVTAAYACGASSYVVKPVDQHRFAETVRAIETYWTDVVRLPGAAG